MSKKLPIVKYNLEGIKLSKKYVEQTKEYLYNHILYMRSIEQTKEDKNLWYCGGIFIKDLLAQPEFYFGPKEDEKDIKSMTTIFVSLRNVKIIKQ